jgi:copper chaperone CopZ
VDKVSIEAAVLEIFAEFVVPALVTEVGSYTVRQAARRVARGALEPQPPPLTAAAPRVHAVADTVVVSHTPGRVRLKVLGLQDDEQRARSITDALTGLPGVDRVCASPLTGNALVEYDGGQVVGVAAIQAALAPAGGGGLARPRRLTLVPRSGPASHRKVQVCL